MISIIVCSVNEDYFNRFKESISKTIGIEYEIIKIDNQKEKLSIAKAYNKGAILSSFDHLVFVHEDVVFHSEYWGQKLVDYFNVLGNPGVLGIAGSNYLPISPSYWWIPDQTRRFCNYMDNNELGKVGEGKQRNSGHENPMPVFLLDGMFLAMKKEAFDKIKFDESLEGFHGYDTAICLRSAIQFQNYFVPDILIEHFSHGKPNSTWLLNTLDSYLVKEAILSQFDFDPKIEIKSYHLFLNHLRKFAPNWAFQMNQSLINAKKLSSKMNSFQVWFLWLWFQLRFLKSDLIR